MGIIIRFIGRLIVSLFLLLFMYPFMFLFVFVLPLIWSFNIKKSWDSFVRVISAPIDIGLESEYYTYYLWNLETLTYYKNLWDYLCNKLTTIKNPDYQPRGLFPEEIKEDKEVKRLKAKKVIVKALDDL